jgi:hypothetical protein
MIDRAKTSRPQKSKWYRKPLKLEGINFNKNHFLIGFQWPYTNCMGTTYLTTMTADGWICECMGFTSHGHCKHIKQVHEKVIAE